MGDKASASLSAGTHGLNAGAHAFSGEEANAKEHASVDGIGESAHAGVAAGAGNKCYNLKKRGG